MFSGDKALAFVSALIEFGGCQKRQHWVLPSVEKSAMQPASQFEIVRDVTPIIPWLEQCFVISTNNMKSSSWWHKLKQAFEQNQSDEVEQKSISSGHAQSDSTSQAMPLIILKAMKIICDAVSSDVRHAGRFFTVADFPTRWGTGSSLEDEVLSVLRVELAEDQTGNERSREFLYNFSRKLSSNQTFSIRVEPVTEKPDIEGLPDTSVEVFWKCEEGANKIYVVVTKGSQQSNPILIMRFYDHEVSPKMGATTPGDSNFFSIERVVRKSGDEFSNRKYLLEAALLNTMNEIKQLENKVLRSFLVTVTCKLVNK